MASRETVWICYLAYLFDTGMESENMPTPGDTAKAVQPALATSYEMCRARRVGLANA
jgi:hypothetical protein